MVEVVFVVAAVGLMALAWWWLTRRRAGLTGAAGPQDAEPGPPQALTRDALLSRRRDFDPSGWDDSPDPSAAPAKPVRPAAGRPTAPTPDADADEEPVYFDRDFLERRQRQRETDAGSDPTPTP